MRFGIGHNTETGNTKKNAETNIGPSSSSSKLSKSYKSRGGSQIHDATKDTELMPNRLASKQAFEMNNCAMLLQVESDTFQASDSSNEDQKSTNIERNIDNSQRKQTKK